MIKVIPATLFCVFISAVLSATTEVELALSRCYIFNLNSEIGLQNGKLVNNVK